MSTTMLVTFHYSGNFSIFFPFIFGHEARLLKHQFGRKQGTRLEAYSEMQSVRAPCIQVLLHLYATKIIFPEFSQWLSRNAQSMSRREAYQILACIQMSVIFDKSWFSHKPEGCILILNLQQHLITGIQRNGNSIGCNYNKLRPDLTLEYIILLPQKSMITTTNSWLVGQTKVLLQPTTAKVDRSIQNTFILT
jgi:hypothetical protein